MIKVDTKDLGKDKDTVYKYLFKDKDKAKVYTLAIDMIKVDSKHLIRDKVHLLTTDSIKMDINYRDKVRQLLDPNTIYNIIKKVEEKEGKVATIDMV